MIIKFWEKKKTIPLRGRLAVLVYIVVLIICGFLLYCAIKPPAYFPFLKDEINKYIWSSWSVFWL